MIEHMHLVGIEIDAGFLIADEGVIGKTVPQAGDDIIEFARPLVALSVFDMLVEAEIAGRIRVGRGDDIPGGAAIADMVERGEAPCDVIRLVERRRGRCGKADLVGDGGERRKKREGFEGRHRVAALQRFDRHVEHGQMIGHEEGIEFRLFQPLGEGLDMVEVEIRIGIGARIAPCAGMQADGTHEGGEVQLSGHQMGLSEMAPLKVAGVFT